MFVPYTAHIASTECAQSYVLNSVHNAHRESEKHTSYMSVGMEGASQEDKGGRVECTKSCHRSCHPPWGALWGGEVASQLGNPSMLASNLLVDRVLRP